jgi:segregation and condensation protein A
MPYEVQTAVFAGPFDLLLHLILREQVDLYEVSLASIVDGYLAALDQMDDFDLEIATEFLLIAATLVELKSKRLLPGDTDLDLDDELGLWEERDLLLARLVECKTFKDAAVVLARLAEQAGRSVPRMVGVDDRFIDLTPELLAGVTPLDLRNAFARASAPRPVPRIDLEHVAPIRISVTDAIVELVDELPRVGQITFRALTAPLVDRIEIVVRFLAVLELYKRGLVDLHQSASFGELSIQWIGGAGDDESVFVELATVDAYDG